MYSRDSIFLFLLIVVVCIGVFGGFAGLTSGGKDIGPAGVGSGDIPNSSVDVVKSGIGFVVNLAFFNVDNMPKVFSALFDVIGIAMAYIAARLIRG